MSLSVEEILGMYERRGAQMYGSEAVNQIEHALQCAALAAEGGASAELVAACLLHDIGHLIAEQPHHVDSAIDDVHQFLAIPFLRGTFCEAVLEPIRLHVDAKRYLCHAQPSYWQGLSAASRHSLDLQGGPYGQIEAERFLARSFSYDAIRLRRWDDQAKMPGRSTPRLEDFAAVLRSLAQASRQVPA